MGQVASGTPVPNGDSISIAPDSPQADYPQARPERDGRRAGRSSPGRRGGCPLGVPAGAEPVAEVPAYNATLSA
jgi:hypothetical protein